MVPLYKTANKLPPLSWRKGTLYLFALQCLTNFKFWTLLLIYNLNVSRRILFSPSQNFCRECALKSYSFIFLKMVPNEFQVLFLFPHICRVLLIQIDILPCTHSELLVFLKYSVPEYKYHPHSLFQNIKQCISHSTKTSWNKISHISVISEVQSQDLIQHPFPPIFFFFCCIDSLGSSFPPILYQYTINYDMLITYVTFSLKNNSHPITYWKRLKLLFQPCNF